MLKHFIATVAILWTTSTPGGVDDAIVMVDGCSGVCVDPSGLVLTVKHCDLPELVTVRFRDRSVSATRVYVCQEAEGPVVFDCDGDGFPHLPVAATAPRTGERLWSYGFPYINNRRELRRASGPLLHWSTFKYGGGSFNGNVVRFGTCPGWSGGPLLNGKGEVCGLLNSTDRATSVFVSSASVRAAYAATRPRPDRQQPVSDHGLPTLYVFGSMSCTPCRQFKTDYGGNTALRRELEADYAVEFVDINKQSSIAKRFGVTQVPTFIVPGRDPIIGYEGAGQLLITLGLRQKIVDRPPPQRQTIPTDPEPAVVPPAVTTPEAPPVPETPTTQPESAPVSTPVATAESSAPTNNAVERMGRMVEKAARLATWLGVGGMTGGAGGLLLGGLALWRTFRRRKRQSHPGRDPPLAEQPPVVTVDTPPPPQAIVPETRFAPYERDTFAEAFAWAETELARKYPGSVGTLESLRGLIDQYLAAKGLTRAERP